MDQPLTSKDGEHSSDASILELDLSISPSYSMKSHLSLPSNLELSPLADSYAVSSGIHSPLGLQSGHSLSPPGKRTKLSDMNSFKHTSSFFDCPNNKPISGRDIHQFQPLVPLSGDSASGNSGNQTRALESLFGDDTQQFHTFNPLSGDNRKQIHSPLGLQQIQPPLGVQQIHAMGLISDDNNQKSRMVASSSNILVHGKHANADSIGLSHSNSMLMSRNMNSCFEQLSNFQVETAKSLNTFIKMSCQSTMELKKVQSDLQVEVQDIKEDIKCISNALTSGTNNFMTIQRLCQQSASVKYVIANMIMATNSLRGCISFSACGKDTVVVFPCLISIQVTLLKQCELLL